MNRMYGTTGHIEEIVKYSAHYHRNRSGMTCKYKSVCGKCNNTCHVNYSLNCKVPSACPKFVARTETFYYLRAAGM